MIYLVEGNDIRTIDLKYFATQLKEYTSKKDLEENPNSEKSEGLQEKTLDEKMEFSFDAPRYRAKILVDYLYITGNKISIFRYSLLIKKK